MVTQQDTATNVDISYKMSSDSSSMNAITILTMVFLPGTFAAVSQYFRSPISSMPLISTQTLFSSVAFRASDAGDIQTTGYLLPLVIVGAILTVTTVCIWYFRKSIGRCRNRLFSRLFRNRIKEAASAGNMV